MKLKKALLFAPWVLIVSSAVATGVAYFGAPCCNVIGSVGGRALVRDFQTGETFSIAGAPGLKAGTVIQNVEGTGAAIKLKLRDTLGKPGDKISAQRITADILPATPCCSIVSLGPVDAAHAYSPVDSLRQIGPVDGFSAKPVGPVDAIKAGFGPVDGYAPSDGALVTAKATDGDRTFAFTVPAALRAGLAVGNNVWQDQTGQWAFLHSSAISGTHFTGSVSTYSYPVGGDQTPQTKQWVLEQLPNGSTMGAIVVTVPADTGATAHVAVDKKGTYTVKTSRTFELLPGDYDITIDGEPYHVPVKAGMATRMLMGVLQAELGPGTRLDLLGPGGKSAFSRSGKTSLSLAVPVGIYTISIAGRTAKVEIKEGQVTKL